MLTLIAIALGALVAIEGGWLGGGAAAGAAKRWELMPLRYGPLGNFIVRFDSATGKLERVRFPANDVVWEEIGVVPPGTKSANEPVRFAPTQPPAAAPAPPPGAPAEPPAAGGEAP
jgi:hypothetical protein